MDRETRKANLKKLRLTGIKHNGNRNLRKNLSDCSSISKYFKSPNTKEQKPDNPKESNMLVHDIDVVKVMEPCDRPLDSSNELSKTKTRKRTSLRKFINKDGTNMDNTVKNELSKNDDEDFEAALKKVKKPTNFRKVRPALNRKRSWGKGQPDIKSSLIRSEKTFSMITSEYCKYENFSADEIHLALALSKSQIETSHTAYLDSVHKRADNIDIGKLDNIQVILRQYGFRPASSGVHNSLSATFLPGARRRVKTKWANKFTALTLRDSKYQTKKLQIKINALMAQNVDMNALLAPDDQKRTYSLLSNHLQKLHPNEPILKVFADEHRTNLDEFYVKNLFEVSNVQSGYLLKDWYAIEGRDISPKHGHIKTTNISSGMDLALSKLEKYYSTKENLYTTSQVANSVLKEIYSSESSLPKNKDIYNLKPKYNTATEKIWEIQSLPSNMPFEDNDDQRNVITSDLNNEKHSISGTAQSNKFTTLPSNSENLKFLPSRNRAQSPNIFASSEDESEEPRMASMDQKDELTSSGEDNLNASDITSSSSTSRSEKINEERANSSEDCIVLSDDEINYSIWKADKREFNSISTNDAELTNCMDDHNNDNLFSIFDVTEGQNEFESNSDITPFPCEKVLFEEPRQCAKANRSTELLEFGILDSVSEPFTQASEIRSPTIQAKSNTSSAAISNIPLGLDDLLTGDISFSKIMGTSRSTEACPKSHTTSLQLCTYLPDEYEIDGRIYSTRIVTGSKPDFTHETEADILKQLYEFGIKPLKRKQAVKMLEYIYNSTHPLILEQTADLDGGNIFHEHSEKNDNLHSVDAISPSDTLQLRDCFGFNMHSLVYNLELDFECEEYIFQTNITKKTSRPLLPFHIAWYNLVFSSTILHEAILMYKPIDLQEIFLFFKKLGYRFDPKDIKEFLDRRCIIFRYDLTPIDRQSNRHIRKSKTNSSKLIKNM